MDDFEKLGFTEYEGKPYTYFFNEEIFRFILIPKSVEEQDNAYFKQLETFGPDKRKNEWIPNNVIRGMKLGTHSEILFSLLDNPSTRNGIAQYPVNWCIELPMNADVSIIDGIEVIGGDANRFYSPNHILEKEFKTDSFSVRANIKESVDCGTFDFDDCRKCTVSVLPYASVKPYDYEKPVSATTQVRFELSKPINLEGARKLYQDIYDLFMYLSCRSNIQFDTIRLIWKRPIQGYPKNHVYGNIHFPAKKKSIDDENKQKQFISSEHLSKHTADLVSFIHQGKVGFQFICDTAAKRNSYPPSRIIAICTEFEREFRNVYGTDVLRHDIYKETKEEIVKLLDSKADDETGKKRQYIKSFSRSVSNFDDSYGQRVRYAMEQNETILKPFLDTFFRDELSELKEGIPDRLNDIRNGLAHSRLDFELTPVNLSDIEVLEILTYIIVLQQFLEPLNVQKAINDLFGFHLFFGDDTKNGEINEPEKAEEEETT